MMQIHTCFISYNRTDLTEQAVSSYRATCTGDATAVIVDNGSDDPHAIERLGREYRVQVLLLGANMYPGFACNRGFEMAPPEATVLHRADNDFVFLPGWVDEIRACFAANPQVGQLGLRTDEEELFNGHNVGGNCAFRKELWDQGLRYDETPWPKIRLPGYTEDSFMSPSVTLIGWKWGRVTKPCIVPISVEDPDDQYYVKTRKDRKLGHPKGENDAC